MLLRLWNHHLTWLESDPNSCPNYKVVLHNVSCIFAFLFFFFFLRLDIDVTNLNVLSFLYYIIVICFQVSFMYFVQCVELEILFEGQYLQKIFCHIASLLSSY